MYIPKLEERSRKLSAVTLNIRVSSGNDNGTELANKSWACNWKRLANMCQRREARLLCIDTLSVLYGRADKPMARGIHCYPISFLFLSPNHRLYIVKCVLYIYIYTRARARTHTHTHTHISDCVEIVCDLPLLPKNTACETFLHKSVAMRNVDWIIIVVAPSWR